MLKIKHQRISIYDDNILLVSYQEALGKHELVGNRLFYEQLKAAKEKRRIQTAMKTAGLPGAKTIEEYDFSFHPHLDQGEVMELFDLSFVTDKPKMVHFYLVINSYGSVAHGNRLVRTRCATRARYLARNCNKDGGGPSGDAFWKELLNRHELR